MCSVSSDTQSEATQEEEIPVSLDQPARLSRSPGALALLPVASGMASSLPIPLSSLPLLPFLQPVYPKTVLYHTAFPG